MTTIHSWLEPKIPNSVTGTRWQERCTADAFADEIIDIADTYPDLDWARIKIDAAQADGSPDGPRKYGRRIEIAIGRLGYQAPPEAPRGR